MDRTSMKEARQHDREVWAGAGVIGIAIGLAGALAGARLIESLLFDTPPHHPAALGGIAALMVAVAGLASALPATRAARLDPMTVLRDD